MLKSSFVKGYVNRVDNFWLELQVDNLEQASKNLSNLNFDFSVLSESTDIPTLEGVKIYTLKVTFDFVVFAHGAAYTSPIRSVPGFNDANSTMETRRKFIKGLNIKLDNPS